jgi:threonine dehydratase
MQKPIFKDIEAAANRLNGIAVRTPILESQAINDIIGGRLLVKAEPLQRTGSFKFRGAYNKICQMSKAERKRGVVAYSSGNHAQGVSAAANLLGAPAIIVMPEDAPQVKLDGTRRWGADIVTYDRSDHDARNVIAGQIAEEKGMTIIPPFDDPEIMAGQGTTGMELISQCKEAGADPDAVITPVGGGGLMSGVATAVKYLSPETELFTAEPEGFDDTARSLASGQRQNMLPDAKSICDALLAPCPGELAFSVMADLVYGGLVVSDDEVRSAMTCAFNHLKLVIEPGGAVGLAAVLNGKYDSNGKTVVVVASGGNVDGAQYAEIVGRS